MRIRSEIPGRSDLLQQTKYNLAVLLTRYQHLHTRLFQPGSHDFYCFTNRQRPGESTPVRDDSDEAQASGPCQPDRTLRIQRIFPPRPRGLVVGEIGVVRVSRLLRSHVSFTSTLPRKGYVIVCPECERPISSELSGLI